MRFGSFRARVLSVIFYDFPRKLCIIDSELTDSCVMNGVSPVFGLMRSGIRFFVEVFESELASASCLCSDLRLC